MVCFIIQFIHINCFFFEKLYSVRLCAWPLATGDRAERFAQYATCSRLLKHLDRVFHHLAGPEGSHSRSKVSGDTGSGNDSDLGRLAVNVFEIVVKIWKPCTFSSAQLPHSTRDVA